MSMPILPTPCFQVEPLACMLSHSSDRGVRCSRIKICGHTVAGSSRSLVASFIRCVYAESPSLSSPAISSHQGIMRSENGLKNLSRLSLCQLEAPLILCASGAWRAPRASYGTMKYAKWTGTFLCRSLVTTSAFSLTLFEVPRWYILRFVTPCVHSCVCFWYKKFF